MFRSVASFARLSSCAIRQLPAAVSRQTNQVNYARCFSTSVSEPLNPGLALPPHGHEETDEEFDARYEGYFNDPNIDGWMIRKRMNDLQGMDLIPEPKIVIAAMKACRRVNDFALCVRYLEAVKFKCGNKVEEIWPYMQQELRPTLQELGISTPEELGYDKPELSLENPYED